MKPVSMGFILYLGRLMKMLTGKKCKAGLSLLMAAMILTSTMVWNAPVSANAATDTKIIQILGTSDLHGRFDAYSYAGNTPNTAGSLTQISQKVKELRSENLNTLLVDAGDTIQDNMADLFLNDPIHPMFVAMNAMKYDTWTVGNHEFNYGADTVERIVKQPTADVLCGNIYKKDGSRLGKPYAIKTVGGVRVAIIGMTTPNIMTWDGPKLEGYKVTSPIDETKAAIQEIKANNAADAFVAVVHMGLKNEYRTDDSAAGLAEACPELSAIVCGHAHETIQGTKVGNAVITEPGKFAENISQIELTVQPKSGGGYEVANAAAKTISMKNAPVDAELNAELKPFHDRAVASGNEIVGTLTGGDLVPPAQVPGITQAQVQDTALMHLILDTQTYYTKQYVPNGARSVTAAALLDSNANIKEGKIKKCDMVNIYKFDNTLYTLKVNGKQLKKYMEWSASYFNQFKDGDLTVSFNPKMASYLYDTFGGVNYEINIAKPAGSRIEKLTYPDGKAVKDTDTIYLTANDYRTSSKLLGDLFKNEKVEVIHKTSDDKIGAVRDMIAMYIQKVKGGTINNTFTPNWKLTGLNINPDKQTLVSKLVSNGTISIPKSDNGKNSNAKSITENDIKPYLSQLVVTKAGAKQTNSSSSGKINSPKTGAENTVLPVGVLMISALGVFALAKKKKAE
jgi:LPXTG-motif cell wall-anchored protein